MARSAALASVKVEDGLTLTSVVGLLGLSLSILLEALAATPFHAPPALLVSPLLLCAVVQVGAGLHEWRREHDLAAVIMISFGLFTCSQISKLGAAPSEVGALLAQGAFLLFWGIFAAILSTHTAPLGRSFQLLLGAVALTLLCKGLMVAFAWTFLWPLALLCGGLAVIAAGFTGFHRLNPTA